MFLLLLFANTRIYVFDRGLLLRLLKDFANTNELIPGPKKIMWSGAKRSGGRILNTNQLVTLTGSITPTSNVENIKKLVCHTSLFAFA